MSNFRKVIEFNEIFGVKKSGSPRIYDEDPDLIKLRMSLITEEYKELVEAVKNKDKCETVDALADLLYVIYGMGHALNVDLDHYFNEVHESNMSKLCISEEEAKKTVKKYKEDYENKRSPYESVRYEKIDENRWKIYNKNTGKVLKNINYKAVNFKELNEIETEVL